MRASFRSLLKDYRNKYEMDDPKQNDEGVLYVRSTCLACLDRTYNCPYCDGEGRTYIQAADKTVARWINNLSIERKNDIMAYITQEFQNEE